jgi:arylsulfatase A-like enzyme
MTHFVRAALAALLIATSATAWSAERTNVIYIMADDLGYTDLACYGSTYHETPNLDRMAAAGMQFTNGYSCGPNCQPTRAALMSGQYGPRTGVYTVGGINRFNWQVRPLRPVDNVTELPLETVTLAQSMNKAGYKTGLFGKWHLGQDEEHHPARRGFDEAIVSMGKHFDFATSPKVEYPKGTYLADFLTDKAVDFLKRHKDEPFFLCLHHFGVHSPYQAKQELIDKFEKKKGNERHNNPVYAAMLYSVDESVGRVLKTLDELKLSDNTLVIFASDNGGVGGYDREGIVKKPGPTDNYPLRSGKGSLYEGGIRIPYLVRWPGKIATGTKCDTPINSVDLYPTLLEVAGASPPAGYPLDGTSYLKLLTSDGKATLDREAIYWHFPGYLGAGENQWRTTPAGAIRSGDWKLVEFFEDGRLELYNLKDDIGEQHNLANQMPDRVKQLHGQLVAWRKQIGAKMPTPNDGKTKQAPGGKKRKKARKAGK